MKKVLEENHDNTNSEHLRIVDKKELKDIERKHTKKINFYEILVAATMGIYYICDDLSYIGINNVVFAFLAYFLLSMVEVKVAEKLLSHIFLRSIIRNEIGEDEEFVWKYKRIK